MCETLLATESFVTETCNLRDMTTVVVSQGTGNWTKIKMAVKDESLRYSLDHFTEVQEVTTLIESVGSICHDDILLEAAEERFIGKFALLFLLLCFKF